MYDLLILISEQSKPLIFKSENICIYNVNNEGSEQHKYYYDIWPFINNACGILYKLFTSFGLGEFECCDELFDYDYSENSEHPKLPGYLIINDEDFLGDFILYRIKQKYLNNFETLINSMLDNSPIKTIIFLMRGQSFDKEIIVGTMTPDKFLDTIQNAGLYTNICYIISKISD